MRLAKNQFDIGLFTSNLDACQRFWQSDVGATFDHVLPIAPGHDQYRHDLLGSVLKINHIPAGLPDCPPTGYRELLVARADMLQPARLAGPNGILVTLVPQGYRGIEQVAVRISVRDLSAQRRFYGQALGLPEESATSVGANYRAGESLIFLEESSDAPADACVHGTGWRYITFQVHKVVDEHSRVLEVAGSEGLPPQTLGTTARYSMVRDPDGNWIELSQRASIVGSLD